MKLFSNFAIQLLDYVSVSLLTNYARKTRLFLFVFLLLFIVFVLQEKLPWQHSNFACEIINYR